MSVGSRGSKASKVSFKLIDSQIKDSTDHLELLILHVGWAKPSSSTNVLEALSLNFHLNYKPTGQIWTTNISLKNFTQHYSNSFAKFDKNLEPPIIPLFDLSRAEEILAYFNTKPVAFNYEITIFLEHFIRSVEMWGQYIIDHLICLNQTQKTISRGLFFSTVNDKFSEFCTRQEIIKSQFPQYFDDLYNSSEYSARNSVRMSEHHRSLSKYNLDKLQEHLSDSSYSVKKNSKHQSSNSSVFSAFKKTKAEASIPKPPLLAGSSLPKVSDVANSLKVEVQRGSSTGSYTSYDILLKVTGKDLKHPKVHSCSQRYSHFKRLYNQLTDINYKVSSKNSSYANFINLITTPFPLPPIKCLFGLTLTDSDLSIRTQRLDSWLRDVIAHYKDMPVEGRNAVKDFLCLDLTNKKDLYIQDQLLWGTVEKIENSKNFLFLHKNIEENLEKNSEKNKFASNAEISSVLLATGVLNNTNTAENIATKTPKNIETNSVRSNNSDSGSLVWETASLGGTSKMQNNKPLAPRYSLFNNKEV